MKKLFLLLMCSLFSIAMQPPPAAAGTKRPAAAGIPEEIEIIKEAESAPAPAKQAREAKQIYILKVPVSGTNITIDEPINIDDVQDIIATETIAELMENAQINNTDLVLARVPTLADGKRHTEYYEATNLQKSLFGNLNAPNPNAIPKYTLKTPTRAPIAGEIYYYVYFPGTDSFDYLGTDQEFFWEGKNQILTQTMMALIDPQNAAKYWARLSIIYREKIHNQNKYAYYVNKATKNLELNDPRKRQQFVLRVYNNGQRHEQEKNLPRASASYRVAYRLGYDFAAIKAVSIRLEIIEQNKKAGKLPDDQTIQLLQNDTDHLITVLKKYPVDSLLKSERQVRIQLMDKLLADLIASDISAESKVFLEQKLQEFKKLAQ